MNERQAEALVRAHEALMTLTQSIGDQMPMDCWTIDLRAAIMALGEVSGGLRWGGGGAAARGMVGPTGGGSCLRAAIMALGEVLGGLRWGVQLPAGL